MRKRLLFILVLLILSLFGLFSAYQYNQDLKYVEIEEFLGIDSSKDNLEIVYLTGAGGHSFSLGYKLSLIFEDKKLIYLSSDVTKNSNSLGGKVNYKQFWDYSCIYDLEKNSWFYSSNSFVNRTNSGVEILYGKCTPSESYFNINSTDYDYLLNKFVEIKNNSRMEGKYDLNIVQ